jgi:hypothetical protein
MSKRLALTAAILWGLVPLLLYLPFETLPAWLEYTVFVGCFPGTLLALVVVGGVHGYTEFFLPLCSVFTFGFAYAGLFWLRSRRVRVEQRARS